MKKKLIDFKFFKGSSLEFQSKHRRNLRKFVSFFNTFKLLPIKERKSVFFLVFIFKFLLENVKKNIYIVSLDFVKVHNLISRAFNVSDFKINTIRISKTT
jgi:hypothetical protein